MALSKKKVFVAMSGGVDSSVAAALLNGVAKPHEFEKLMGRPAPKGLRGFAVVGIHIKMWVPGDGDPVCRQQHEDRIAAMRAAAHLGIPFQTWDFTNEYRAAVVDYMIREYAGGRTPNPDVMCNREIKFGAFLRRALASGAEYVATGHYARKREVRIQNSKLKVYQLLSARDENKDQTYFLWTLGQEELRHCLFPIGDMTKPEVRAYARQIGLPNAEKPDSQGICFIGDIDVPEFLAKFIPSERGEVRMADGRVIGEHAGAAFYTVGQRHGIGIGGGVPYYVAEKNVAANTLVVAEGAHDSALYRKELAADTIRWTSGRAPEEFPMQCMARIRYRQPLQSCRIEAQNCADRTQNNAESSFAKSGVESASVRVIFDQPQRAVAPGQSIVLYRGTEMLGGGIIAG